MPLTEAFLDRFSTNRESDYTKGSWVVKPWTIDGGRLDIGTLLADDSEEIDASPHLLSPISVEEGVVVVAKVHMIVTDVHGGYFYAAFMEDAEWSNLPAPAVRFDVDPNGINWATRAGMLLDNTLDPSAPFASGTDYWLVGVMNTDELRAQVWGGDPGGGGTLLLDVPYANWAPAGGGAGGAVPTSPGSLVFETIGGPGSYVDYWRVFTGVGAIPPLDSPIPPLPPDAPSVSLAARALYDRLGPWKRADEGRWDLLHLCEAVMGRLQPLEDVIRDQGDKPGWSQVVDIDRVPTEWLPWLGQFVGVRPRAGLSEDAQRVRVKETDGFNRGSPGAIKGAARQYLIGPDGTPETASVYLTERHGSAYRLTVATLTSETPDPAKVLSGLKEQKPAGIVMDHSVITGGDFDSLRDTHSDFNSITALYTDLNEVRDNPTKV